MARVEVKIARTGKILSPVSFVYISNSASIVFKQMQRQTDSFSRSPSVL